ncbi:hypothetical protein AC1031_007032 [Aphanomyces cochlioides]|nr:hypothetical protein AC1031_007032 [Aphanomyces cochlioides]
MPELHLHAVGGRNLYDAQTFGKQDPFCKIQVGNQLQTTRVHDNGDRCPVWNEKFVFHVRDPQVDQITITIEDENTFVNGYIGTVCISVNTFLHGQFVDQWFPVMRNTDHYGDINLRIQLMSVPGEMAGVPAPQPGYPVAQPGLVYSAAPPPPVYVGAPVVYETPVAQEPPVVVSSVAVSAAAGLGVGLVGGVLLDAALSDGGGDRCYYDSSSDDSD